MGFFMPNKLNPQGQKLLTIIIALPVFVSTSYILYKRLATENGGYRPIPQHIPRHTTAKTQSLSSSSPVDDDNDLPPELLAQIQKDHADWQQQQQQQSSK